MWKELTTSLKTGGRIDLSDIIFETQFWTILYVLQRIFQNMPQDPLRRNSSLERDENMRCSSCYSKLIQPLLQMVWECEDMHQLWGEKT